jgi:hypothetical protein
MEIDFYEKSPDHFPVPDYVQSLDTKHKKQIRSRFNRLEDLGLERLLYTRDVKKLRDMGHDIYYLRVIPHRIAFIIQNNTYLMFYGFVKKSKDIPKKHKKNIINVVETIKNSQ